MVTCLIAIGVFSSCSQDEDTTINPIEDTSWSKEEFIPDTTNLIGFAKTDCSTRGGTLKIEFEDYVYITNQPSIRVTKDRRENGARIYEAYAYPVDMELSNGKRFVGRMFITIKIFPKMATMRIYNAKEDGLMSLFIFGDIYELGERQMSKFTGRALVEGINHKFGRINGLPSYVNGYIISCPGVTLEMWRQ